MTSPSVDGSATGIIGNNQTSGTASLTTTAAGEIVVVVGLSQNASRTVTSVTASGLTFAKRGGGPLHFSGDAVWFGDLEIWSAPSAGAVSSKVITVNTSAGVDLGAIVAFGVSGGIHWDTNSGLPVEANTASLSFSTDQPDDLLIYCSVSEANGGVQGVPAGYTQINAAGSGAGLRFIGLRVSALSVSAAQSAVSVGSGGTNIVNLVDAYSNTGLDQTLTPSLFTDADSFFAPTVILSDQYLVPALFTDADTFFAPAIKIDQFLVPALFSDADTFFGPAVTGEGITLAPNLFVDPDTFYSPTIAAEGTLLPALFTDTDTFYLPTVTRGAVTLAPNLFSDADTFFANRIGAVGVGETVNVIIII